MPYNISHLMKFIQEISQRFLPSGTRSQIIIKNIFGSLGLKLVNIATSFLVIPITLKYLDKINYGIWVALTSFIAWFLILDIGLGNGLRNKFAEARAHGDFEKTKIYVSTTYILILGLVIVLLGVFSTLTLFINWSSFLNIPQERNIEIRKLVLVVYLIMSFHFLLKPISMILLADLKTFLNDFIKTTGSVLSLGGVYYLSKSSSTSLVDYAVIYTSIPIIVMLIASLWLFWKPYKYCRPSLRFFNIEYIRPLFLTGSMFFILQICGIILFQAPNLVISHYMGPAEVTVYSIAYKYYSTIFMFYDIIVTPYWSGFTEAYQKRDFEWIRNVIKKFNSLWFFILIIFGLLIFINPIFFKLWLNKKIVVPVGLSLSISLFLAILLKTMPYLSFLNGTSKIRIQIYYTVLEVILFLPVSHLFIKTFNLGSIGMALTMAVLTFPGVFIYRWQVNHVLKKENPLPS